VAAVADKGPAAATDAVFPAAACEGQLLYKPEEVPREDEEPPKQARDQENTCCTCFTKEVGISGIPKKELNPSIRWDKRDLAPAITGSIDAEPLGRREGLTALLALAPCREHEREREGAL